MVNPSLNQRICCLSRQVDSLSEATGGSQALVEWTTGENFRLPTINRDSDDVITTATVKWPDGYTGVFTTLVKDNTFLTIDSFTITHGSTTITQPLITRNSNGAAIVVPDLIFS